MAEPTYRWEALATFNAERHRGMAHTAEYEAAMAAEQAAFDREQLAQMRRDYEHVKPMGESGWLCWNDPPARPRLARAWRRLRRWTHG